MDATDSVISVSSAPEQVLGSATTPTREATVSASEREIPPAKEQNSDAVKVSVSPDESRVSLADAEAQAKIRRATVEEQASQLERTLNSKVVRFRVAIKDGSSAEMHFQVVDRETGKIVREFPPEKANDFKDIAGLMLDTEI